MTPWSRISDCRNDGELVVSFAIERGPRYRLAAVTLEGNQFFPSLVLEPQLRLGAGQPFDGARLQADVSAIQELYRRRGFASAEVDASVERVASGAGDADVALGIRIVIVEHAQTIVESVRVEGNTTMSEVELTAGLGLRPGAEFFATQLAIDRDAVQAKYANLGFLHATVETDPGLCRRRPHAPTSCSGCARARRSSSSMSCWSATGARARKRSNASCRSRPATR